MASLSKDIARDVLRHTKNAIQSFMKSPEFVEGVYDAVARSTSRRILEGKKYTIRDNETGEEYSAGKVEGGEAGVLKEGQNNQDNQILWLYK